MVSVRLAVAGENEAITAKIDLVMTRMDTLFNILDFRPHNAGSGGAYCEQPPLQGEQIGDNSGDVANQQLTLGEDCSYVTPPTPIHKGVSYVKNGDEFENHGRQLRRKKRSQALLSPYLEWSKRARFTRSKRHTFEPFRQPYEKDKQVFWKWFNSDTKSRSTIRCGLAMQNRHFFEIMLHNSAFLNSEHVDEILYLLRKRIDKFPDIFPKDICILSDCFLQTLCALYEDTVKDFNVTDQEKDFNITDEMKDYYKGVRPSKGRDWAGVSRFYVPCNCFNRHWILLVDVLTWIITVYDSVPTCLSLTDLNAVVKPYLEYFPFLLKKSEKFASYEEKFKRSMILVQLAENTVPIKRSVVYCSNSVNIVNINLSSNSTTNDMNL